MKNIIKIALLISLASVASADMQKDAEMCSTIAFLSEGVQHDRQNFEGLTAEQLHAAGEAADVFPTIKDLTHLVIDKVFHIYDVDVDPTEVSDTELRECLLRIEDTEEMDYNV